MIRKKNFIFFIIIVAMISILSIWPGKRVYFTSSNSETIGTICENVDISNRSYVEQMFVAKTDYLDSIEVVFSRINNIKSGSIVLSILDAEEEIVKNCLLDTDDLLNGVSNEVSIRVHLNSGEIYYVVIETENVDNYIAVGLQNANDENYCEYNNEILQGVQLGIGYNYKEEINFIQTLMLCLVIFCIMILSIKVVCLFEHHEWDEKLVRKNYNQGLVILDIVALFLFTALISPLEIYPLTIEKGVFIVAYILLCIILSFLALRRYFKKNKFEISGKFLKEKCDVLVFLFIIIVARIPMLGSFQRWDAGEYYYRLGTACKNFTFTFRSFFQNFRLCGHSCLGFSGIMAIGEFLNPRGIIGVQVVIMILTIMMIYCMYVLFAEKWVKCSRRVALLLALFVSFIPLFYGTYSYLNPDYFMALFFIFMLYAEHKKWYVLMAFCAIITSQSKETGVIVIASYIGIKMLIVFCVGKEKFFTRIWKALSSPLGCIGVLSAAIYALQIFLMQKISMWGVLSVTKTETNESTSWLQKLNFEYMFWRLKQYFVLNFAWLLSIMLIIGIIVFLVRILRKQYVKNAEIVGEIVTLLGLVFFGMFYVTANLNRYNVLIDVLFAIVTISLFYEAIRYIKKEKILRIIFGVGIVLFGVQSFYSMDPISNLIFEKLDTGTTIMLTTTNGSYRGDGLVNNYQYSWLDRALNIVFKNIDYEKGVSIVVPSAYFSGAHINGNGSVYCVGWDTIEERRCMYDEEVSDSDVIPINMKYVSNVTSSQSVLDIPYDKAWYWRETEEISKSEKLTDVDRAVLFFIPYYDVNEDEVLEIVSENYYIGYEQYVEVSGGSLNYYELIPKDSYLGITLENFLAKENKGTLSLDQILLELSEYYNEEVIETACKYFVKTFDLYEDYDSEIVEEDSIVWTCIYAYDTEGNEIPMDEHGKRVYMGAGNIIDGVEEAILGTKAGDHVEVMCTIPENYPNAGKYAGKECLFAIDIIKFEGKVIEMEVSDEYAQAVYETCEEVIWNAAVKRVAKKWQENGYSLDIPYSEELYNERYMEVYEYYTDYLNNAKVSKKQFAEEYLNITLDELDSGLIEIVINSLQNDILFEKLENYKTSIMMLNKLGIKN